MATNGDNLGARIRMARAHAGGISHAELAARIGIGRDAVIDMEQNRRALRVPEALRISDATGVPTSFLVHGWAAPPELVERVGALEGLSRSVQRERDELIARVDRLEGEIQTLLASVATESETPQQPPDAGVDRPKQGGQPTP